MKIKKFKNDLYKIIDQAEEIINKMPDKGNSCSESQKICLKIRINELSSYVNGTTQIDLDESKE